MLVWEFGSEDSSHRSANYFEADGTLRFVFVRVGSVPSAWVEARWWLEHDGKIVKKARKIGGEGFTGYASELKDYAVPKPAQFVTQHTTKCR